MTDSIVPGTCAGSKTIGLHAADRARSALLVGVVPAPRLPIEDAENLARPTRGADSVRQHRRELGGLVGLHPEAAVAGPRLVDGGGRMELSFGRMITPFAELRRKLTSRLYERGWSFVARRLARAASREQYVDWVSGAVLLR